MMKECTCKICGKTFKPTRGSQLCCSDECKRENVRRHSKELRKRNKSLRLADKKMQKQKTDWAEITKKCKEAGLTYGQAVARGLFDAEQIRQ